MYLCLTVNLNTVKHKVRLCRVVLAFAFLSQSSSTNELLFGSTPPKTTLLTVNFPRERGSPGLMRQRQTL